MAYTAWSVIYGETPSAAKWNLLGTNDASFNDGTGILDDKIITRHILDNNITGSKLATDAILLGYKTLAGQTGISGETLIDLSSGTGVTVTVPAGGRSLKISYCLYTRCITTGPALHVIKIKDGATTGSTDLDVKNTTIAVANNYASFSGFAIVSAPAAGNRTFSLTGAASAGTMTINNYGALLVELI